MHDFIYNVGLVVVTLPFGLALAYAVWWISPGENGGFEYRYERKRLATHFDQWYKNLKEADVSERLTEEMVEAFNKSARAYKFNTLDPLLNFTTIYNKQCRIEEDEKYDSDWDEEERAEYDRLEKEMLKRRAMSPEELKSYLAAADAAKAAQKPFYETPEGRAKLIEEGHVFISGPRPT